MTGEPSHFEIGVPDPERARRFFGQVLGWPMRETRAGAARVETRGLSGGIHGDDPDASIEVFFTVDDIDEAVRLIRDLGGEAGDPTEESSFGRYVYGCRDDQGVRFGLHQPPD